MDRMEICRLMVMARLHPPSNARRCWSLSPSLLEVWWPSTVKLWQRIYCSIQILRQRTARKTILTLHNKTSDGLLSWRRLEKEILEKHQQKVKSTTHWPYRMDNARGVNRKNCTTIGDFVPSLPGLRKVNPPLARPPNDLRFNRCHSLFIYLWALFSPHCQVSFIQPCQICCCW